MNFFNLTLRKIIKKTLSQCLNFKINVYMLKFGKFKKFNFTIWKINIFQFQLVPS